MVNPPRAGTITARLLTAPHLFHPGWLLSASPRTGPPGTGPPGTGPPGTGPPGHGSPGTGPPGTGPPGTGSPGTGPPGTGPPGHGSPGTGPPGHGSPGTGPPGTGSTDRAPSGTAPTSAGPDDPTEPAGRGQRPKWPRTTRVATGHGRGAGDTESTEGAGSGAIMDAVPFAAATPIAPAVAGRLAAAVRAAGERLVFACPVAAARSAEVAATIPADGARIHAALQALGTPDALVVLPDLSAALLTTPAGFAVAAGPRQFVEAAAGADVRRARTGFAEFALACAKSSMQPLHAARYYGCALSGRPWRPFWLAWSRAEDVPRGSGIGGQLSAMRQFVEGGLSAADFERMFRSARQREMWAGERAAGPLAAALDSTCWALDGYVPPDEGYPRTPGQFDLDGLREAVSVALRDV